MNLRFSHRCADLLRVASEAKRGGEGAKMNVTSVFLDTAIAERWCGSNFVRPTGTDTTRDDVGDFKYNIALQMGKFDWIVQTRVQLEKKTPVLP